jgi:DNA polymerase III delta subunit
VLNTAGVSGVRLVALLGTHLVGVRLARALLASRTAPGRLPGALFQQIRKARPLNLGDWKEAAAAWANAAPGWTLDGLNDAVQEAYDADRALKSTTIADESDILTDLLLRLHTRKVAA